MRRLALAFLVMTACSDGDGALVTRDASAPKRDAKVIQEPETRGPDASAVRDASALRDGDVIDAAPALPTCNPRGCRAAQSACTRDEDCCQPRNVQDAPARCIGGGCSAYMPNSTAAYVPLPTCLPDGGIAACVKRGELCESDGDCCQSEPAPDALSALHCIGNFCDIYAF
jgi:hypothetical protein